MLAIHNTEKHNENFRDAANAFAKLSKCQQFTTSLLAILSKSLLQTLLQSYQNVSNSQPRQYAYNVRFCCKRFCKVIKMLAIHNSNVTCVFIILAANAFAKLSKCQQFTTVASSISSCKLLQTLLQSYQNVSNSQLLQIFI